MNTEEEKLLEAHTEIQRLKTLLAQQAKGDREGLILQLERSNQELKQFAYIVSHDLKAPLRAISSLTQWIAEDYSGLFDEDGREQVALLVSRVKRMERLIEGVLHYSRIGRLQEEPVVVNLNKLVRELIVHLQPPKNVRIDMLNHLPVVFGDKTRLAQVFQNLLSNAIKFMDKPHGIIRVDCVQEGEAYHFTVADNGPGIPEKEFERIFQIFQTLHARDEYESTGIGLTLVKKIVEFHGGRVWVTSTVGEGSLFHLTLPVHHGEGAP
ncbi:MAG: GHKL domain-containing protein [Magnetococcales bacterium]|nr:GHKL domain-containing protein [Magnetococcales bacterium]